MYYFLKMPVLFTLSSVLGCSLVQISAELDDVKPNPGEYMDLTNLSF